MKYELFGDPAALAPPRVEREDLPGGAFILRHADAGTNAGYRLPMGTPGYSGLWSYLTAVAGAPMNALWGPNPHTTLL